MPVNTTFGGESAARSRSVALGRVGRAELHRGLSIAATTPGERFLEAYRAARTAAGALLAPGPRRRGPSDVWHRLAAEHPDLGEGANVLRGYSRPGAVGPGMADDFGWAVGRFLGLLADRLGVLGSVA